MHTVLCTPDRALLSLSTEERHALVSALNEVCNGVHIADFEYQLRLGVTREFMRSLLSAINAEPHQSRCVPELVSAWAEHGTVMVRAFNVYGDPVELGEAQAGELSGQLERAIREAS